MLWVGLIPAGRACSHTHAFRRSPAIGLMLQNQMITEILKESTFSLYKFTWGICTEDCVLQENCWTIHTLSLIHKLPFQDCRTYDLLYFLWSKNPSQSQNNSCLWVPSVFLLFIVNKHGQYQSVQETLLNTGIHRSMARCLPQMCE